MEQKFNLPIVNRNDGHLDLFYYSNIGMYRMTLCEPKQKSNAAFISTVLIDENHRGEGHGNELLEHAENEARKWGCNAITLEVKWKSWKRDWYERKGFLVVHELYYDEKTVVMTKILL